MSRISAGDSRDAIVGVKGDLYFFFNRKRLEAFLIEFLNSGNLDLTLGKRIDEGQHGNLKRVDLDSLTEQQAEVMLADVQSGGGPWG